MQTKSTIGNFSGTAGLLVCYTWKLQVLVAYGISALGLNGVGDQLQRPLRPASCISVSMSRCLPACLSQVPQYLARELRRLSRRQIVLKALTDSAGNCPQRR